MNTNNDTAKDDKKHTDKTDKAPEEKTEKELHFNTVEEYRKATDTGGHHADDALDYKDIEQPQDKDKIVPTEDDEE